MATLRKSVQIVAPSADAYPDRIGNQCAMATNSALGNIIAYVMTETAGDATGIYVQWSVPKNYGSTPKLVVKGVLDGAMSSVTLAFTFSGLALQDNEVYDAAFATADLGNISTDHGDEDAVECSFALTNTAPAIDDIVYGYLALDTDQNSYTGNFLLTSVEFEYADS